MYKRQPHGFAAAITLPQVAEINRPVTENYDELEAVFAPFGGIQEWMDFVAQGVQDLQLRAFGITQQDIPTIVQYAFTAGRMDNNPRELTDEDVQLILKNIW